MMRIAAVALVGAAVSCGPAGPTHAPMAEPGLERRIAPGALRGIAQPATETHAWLGIPYAKPPIGELRWRAPRPPDPWSGMRSAARSGHACAQLGGFQGPPLEDAAIGPARTRGFGQPVGSEDCLTLNVWRPASAEPLPVVVFIHGGSNIAGYAGDPLYDGAELARRTRTVVVSINYRLGVFGWFLHPALRTGDALDDSGNLGLLDIIQALRFVRTEIAAFGGLADQVTVMGQSAGAVNALSLMVSPLTEGLFTRVIALSGALQSKPRADRDGYAQRVFDALLARTGAREASLDDAWRRGFLRGQDTATLVRAAAGISGSGWGTADGTVLPLDVDAAIAAGRLRDVPLIVGFTRDEGTFFVPDAFAVSEAERVQAMDAFDPDHPGALGLADLVKPAYRSADAFRARAAQMTEVIHGFVLGTLQRLGPRLAQVHAMRFDWARQVEPWRTLLGASHAMELPFVFHNFGRHYFSCAFGSANAAGRESLSRRITDSLAAFVRTGDPDTPSLGAPWRPWRPSAPEVFVWDADRD